MADTLFLGRKTLVEQGLAKAAVIIMTVRAIESAGLESGKTASVYIVRILLSFVPL